MFMPGKVSEAVDVFIGDDDNAAAVAAIAAVRPSRGALNSWRKLMQPSPPSPPLTKMVMRSRNMATRRRDSTGT